MYRLDLQSPHNIIIFVTCMYSVQSEILALTLRFHLDSLQMFTCDVCNKVFNTRGNYNRHRSRHNDVDQHQCSECGKVFARRDNYLRHLKSQHGDTATQTGYGTVEDTAVQNEPTPKRQKLLGDVRGLYRITRVKEVDMKKYKTKGLEYIVKFNDDLDIHNPATVLKKHCMAFFKT